MDKNNPGSDIQSKLRRRMLEAATASVTMVILGIVKEFFPLILEKVIPELSKRSLLGLSALSTLVAFFEFVCIFYLLRKTRLIPRFGVYWDKKGNAYCPSCKQLLSHHGLAHFYCGRCKTPILLKSEEGDKSIAVSAARELLKV